MQRIKTCRQAQKRNRDNIYIYSVTGCTQKRDDDSIARTIPIGWFDTGDGMYNPENHVIHKYGTEEFLRHAGAMKHLAAAVIINIYYYF